MNKFIKGALCAGLCLSLFAFTGCKDSSLDSETRHLKLATGALDGNFNPFFYTSGNDGNMISLTQIGMLTTDENGNIVAGEDWPTVALDYKYTTYDKDGNVSATGSTDGSTVYEFVIKNGIKFSDGVPLTIDDVLFNLYVYLDPAYTGSATIYSTDIQGLNAYRAQDPTLTDDSEADYESGFLADAQARILKLINWSIDNDPLDAQGEADLETVKKLFKEEAESDWTTVYSSFPDSYKDAYRFTEVWEAYLLQEGIIQVQTQINANGTSSKIYEDLNGNGERDDGELYYTTLDPNQSGSNKGTVESQHYIDLIKDATTDSLVNAYMTANNCDRDYAVLQLQKEACVQLVYDNYTDKSKIAEVVLYWGTATTALQQFAADERTKYYDEITSSGKGVDSVSGITTYKTTSFNGTSLDGEHDVLRIVINGVDPKAIYNFAFTVAPLHYYSGTYNGVDYIKAFDGVSNFGVKVGDDKFFSDVLQSNEKQGLPVGAGPYMATTQTGETGDKVTRYTFCSNNSVYFVRNDYFETVGAGIENAKIKYINYKVYTDDMIMTALMTEEIDFGTPNATPTNQGYVSNTEHLDSATWRTGGYGYVGINPKYVPEYKIRQAIMKSMNTNMTISYYGSKLAEVINRPMSTTSWAYPSGVEAYESVAYTTSDNEILQLVAEAGYTLQNGVLTKTENKDGMSNAPLGTTLKFTFTIAGDTTDHPAYKMFCDSRDRLNELGFEITVLKDSTALSNLAQGKLAIWAAAWSSASDPDMYQVYHKDSKATSVSNWNYPNILNDTQTWIYEYNIITQLSDKIDEARESLEQADRIPVYAECLDLVMDLAVELPTYQRSDLGVYNKTVIDANTLVKNPTFNMGLFDRLWEIDYV